MNIARKFLVTAATLLLASCSQDDGTSQHGAAQKVEVGLLIATPKACRS